LQTIKNQIAEVCNHSQHPELKRHASEIKHFVEKLITNIPECLHESFMKVAYKLLSRNKVTFEELTTQEQELLRKFENKH
jgi:hypothetical protein